MTIDQIMRLYEHIPRPAQLAAIPERDFRLSPRDGEYLKNFGVTDFRLQVTPPTLEALYRARERLDSNEQLHILSAYRPVELLAILWHKRIQEVKNANPTFDDTQITQFARVYTAAPDHPGFPPHSRGDAVDIGLLRDGRVVSMYVPPQTFDQMHFDFHEGGKDDHIHRNRVHLRRIMSEAGFIPYDREYWHFGLTPVFPPKGGA